MKIHSLANISVQQLQRVLKIKQQIEALEKELSQIYGAEQTPLAPARRRRKRFMSATAKAKIAAAQKTRWAKSKKADASRKPASKGKRKISPEGRARIAAAAKARWAKFRAEQK